MSVGERLITRAEWRARRPKTPSAIPGPVRGNTIHWEGPRLNISRHSQCPGLVRGIQAHHMDGKGWSDIAYSSVVCPHGFVFEGRWLGVRTAAQGTKAGNDTHYAHCYLGGEGDPFTDEARTGLTEVVNFFRANGAGTELRPHRFWHATACPGPELTKLVAAGIPLSPPTSEPPTFPGGIRGAVGLVARPGGGGWVVASDGGVFAMGDTPFFGSKGGQPLSQPVAGGAATPSGGGYWLVARDGGVFSFGDATFHGSMAGRPLGAPIAAIAGTPDGGGYWLIGRDGGVFAFGNAVFAGSMAGKRLGGPIVAAAATPRGYLLAGADGGVFGFSTDFFGSLAGHNLNAPIVGMAVTPTGAGYWLFSADGGVFAFGDAPFRGVYAALMQEYQRRQRRIVGGAFVGDASIRSTWGYDLFSERLPVERYHFAA